MSATLSRLLSSEAAYATGPLGIVAALLADEWSRTHNARVPLCVARGLVRQAFALADHAPGAPRAGSRSQRDDAEQAILDGLIEGGVLVPEGKGFDVVLPDAPPEPSALDEEDNRSANARRCALYREKRKAVRASSPAGPGRDMAVDTATDTPPHVANPGRDTAPHVAEPCRDMPSDTVADMPGPTPAAPRARSLDPSPSGISPLFQDPKSQGSLERESRANDTEAMSPDHVARHASDTLEGELVETPTHRPSLRIVSATARPLGKHPLPAPFPVSRALEEIFATVNQSTGGGRLVLEDEHAKFCAYYRSEGTECADWAERWRGWLLKAKAYEQPSLAKSRGPIRPSYTPAPSAAPRPPAAAVPDNYFDTEDL